MSRRSLRRSIALLFVFGLLVALAPAATAAHHTEPLYSWTELTEGVAVDNDGNIFVSSSPAGELWKIAPGAAGPEVFGAVDGINAAAGDIGLLGLAADRHGNIYGAVHSPNGLDAHGVWVFDAATGDATRLAGSEHIEFPNSVAFDARGNLYVTDTALGAVWRYGRHGFEPWVVDPLMLGNGSLGVGNPVGANGLAIVGRTVYVSVTGRPPSSRCPSIAMAAPARWASSPPTVPCSPSTGSPPPPMARSSPESSGSSRSFGC